MNINIKRFSELAKIPTQAHSDDFAYDIYATSVEKVGDNIYKYGIGWGMQMAPDDPSVTEREFLTDVLKNGLMGIRIVPRSSIWKTGMVLSNSEGVIDAGYTGEIKAVFYKVIPDGNPYEVGDRIGQMYIMTRMPTSFTEVDELVSTDRGDGGFGSSGK